MITNEEMLIAGYKCMNGYPNTFINRDGNVYIRSSINKEIVVGGKSFRKRENMFFVILSNSKNPKQMSLQRAVMILFNPIKNPEDYFVRNKTGDSMNVSIDNLKWVKKHKRKEK